MRIGFRPGVMMLIPLDPLRLTEADLLITATVLFGTANFPIGLTISTLASKEKR